MTDVIEGKDMSLPHNMVAEFIKAMGASLDPRIWIKLIEEEEKELVEAINDLNDEQIIKEACDLFYVQVGFNAIVQAAEQLDLLPDEEREHMMEIVKRSADTYARAVDLLNPNTNLYEAFRRVHNSNMSKLGPDGKPVKRADGKVMKGPNYKPPKLKDLVIKSITLVQ